MKRHATLASLFLSGFGARKLAAAAALAVLLFAAAGARACEFPIVKEQIDIVLDRDARLGAEFRAQVKDGSDSVAVIELLVSAEMREKVDVCRFYVAEYLTKQGLPAAALTARTGARSGCGFRSSLRATRDTCECGGTECGRLSLR